MRFELEINGEKICIAGLDGYAVLSAVVTWAKRDPSRFDQKKLPHSTLEQFSQEDLHIQLGGLDSNDPARAVDKPWHHRDLKVGDEITIRILPPGLADAPLEPATSPNN